MYVIVEHAISNPKTFWDRANSLDIPSKLKLHQVFPNTDGKKAVCVWEADSEKTVKDYVEKVAGDVSKNVYFAVDSKKAKGIPNAKMATAAM